MIRVTLRKTNEDDATLLGDFQPNQIAELEELVASTPIYSPEDIDAAIPERVWRQWELSGTTNQRWCLELVYEMTS